MESQTSNNNIKAINNVSMLFNGLRSNLSCEEINRIRKNLYKKEAVSIFFKEKKQKGSLTNKQKNVLKNIGKYLKNTSKHLVNLKKHFKTLQKYQYGIDYLFNERNEESNAFQEAKKLFNERRSNLSLKEINEIRKKTL